MIKKKKWRIYCVFTFETSTSTPFTSEHIKEVLGWKEYKCITTSLHHYFSISLHHYITTALHHYITTSLYYYFDTSLHHYIRKSLHNFTFISDLLYFTSFIWPKQYCGNNGILWQSWTKPLTPVYNRAEQLCLSSRLRVSNLSKN